MAASCVEWVTFGSCTSRVSRSTRCTAGCVAMARASSTTYFTCAIAHTPTESLMQRSDVNGLLFRTHPDHPRQDSSFMPKLWRSATPNFASCCF